MQRFIEIAHGVMHRNNIIPSEKLDTQISIAQLRKSDLFRSYYTYDDEIQKHVGEVHSVANFKGNYYLQEIVLDIDKGMTSDEEVYMKALNFYEKLLHSGISKEHIHIYFSGSGYHFHIPDLFGFEPANNMPQIVRSTMTALFPEADDIYDGPRLIRVANTLNMKTGRYKIFLPEEFFLNIGHEGIIELAHTKPTELPPKMPAVKEHLFHNRIVYPRIIELPIDIKSDKVDDAIQVVTCVQKMWNEGPLNGTRHKKLLRMASAFRRNGVPKVGIIGMLRQWAGGLPAQEVDRIVDNVFKTPLRYGCDDALMSAYCDSRCVFFRKKNYLVKIANANSMEATFQEYAKTDFSETSINLNQIYPGAVADYGMYPGELVLLQGDTGLGKTAWIQNVCVALNKIRILFLSLEVHQNLIFRRFVQIAHGMTKEEVFNHYKSNTTGLAKPISHIHVMTAAPDLGSISKLIAEFQPRLVVIDTTDGIDIPNQKDMNAKGDTVARSLKEIAQAQDVIIVGIHHISKSAARDGIMDVHSGKGSSSWEQKADKVISIEGVRTMPTRVITSQKARDEAFFRLTLNSDVKTLKFSQFKEKIGATVDYDSRTGEIRDSSSF